MNGYVEAGYIVTVVSVGGYTARVLHRSRQLVRALKPRPAVARSEQPERREPA